MLGYMGTISLPFQGSVSTIVRKFLKMCGPLCTGFGSVPCACPGRIQTPESETVVVPI